ncbi:MAG: hypothetical protein MRZ79_16200 [Bacteroidia bacterium]|nr:hypothetical protein [Bacteroidia bacterium]
MNKKLLNSLTKTAGIYEYQLADFQEEDAYDIIAKDFQERANTFLDRFNGQQIGRYKGRVDVHVQFVEPLPGAETKGFDTFVAPLIFSQENGFGIFISVKMLRSIVSIFNFLLAGPNKGGEGISKEEVDTNFQEVYTLTFSSLVYILMHEYSHVLRAHIPYLDSDAYRKASSGLKLAMHEGENLSSDVSANYIRLHRSMEVEADLIALGLIVEMLSNEEMEAAFLLPNAELNDPEVFGKSIFLLMRLMELWRQTLSSQTYDAAKNGHPHPEIRQLFLDSWLLARQKEDRGEAFFRVSKGLQKGMDEIREKIYDFGPEFLPNLQYIMGLGQERTLSEYEVLQEDLYDYLKPGLAKFSI